MIRHTIVAMACAMACMTPFACQAAVKDADIRALVDTTIKPLMAAHNVPGMTVGLTMGGKAHYFHYGLAEQESKTPVSDATLFELGSISKTLTATLASYAMVQGKLALTDHPSKYMPQLAGSAIDKATVLHLGTYTAGGLPLQFPEDMTAAGMADYFQKWKPDAAPGTVRQYSNPSLGLFGHVSALALKTSFSDAMEQQLFPQLGFTSTYVRVPAAAMKDYASGYNRSGKAVRMSSGVHATEAYGVRSNVIDMVRYLQVNIDPGALPEQMRRAVEGTHVGYFQAGEMLQGLGWEQYPYPVTLMRLLAGNSETIIFDPVPVQPASAKRQPSGAALYNKTGSTSGFGSYIAFIPKQKVGIVMMANKNYPIPARVEAAHRILTQLTQRQGQGG